MFLFSKSDAPNPIFDYKKEKSFEERLQESTKIMEKYPDKIPIIVSKCSKSHLNNIDKNKYLVSNDMTLSQFIYTIRKRIKLEASEALFFFIDNTVPKNSAPIGELYNLHKDKDGFLYITYNSENTFG
jgi:GABA(A) receptor-associated protein